MSLNTRRPAYLPPASVKITSTENVSNDEAEQIITGLLDGEELPNIHDTIKAQMRKTQRDLRGLPPLMKKHQEDSEHQEVEDPMDVDEDVDMEVEEDEEQAQSKLSKEERKKQKKERRKEEKKQKAEANAAKNTEE